MAKQSLILRSTSTKAEELEFVYIELNLVTCVEVFTEIRTLKIEIDFQQLVFVS